MYNFGKSPWEWHTLHRHHLFRSAQTSTKSIEARVVQIPIESLMRSLYIHTRTSSLGIADHRQTLRRCVKNKIQVMRGVVVWWEHVCNDITKENLHKNIYIKVGSILDSWWKNHECDSQSKWFISCLSYMDTLHDPATLVDNVVGLMKGMRSVMYSFILCYFTLFQAGSYTISRRVFSTQLYHFRIILLNTY